MIYEKSNSLEYDVLEFMKTDSFEENMKLLYDDKINNITYNLKLNKFVDVEKSEIGFSILSINLIVTGHFDDYLNNIKESILKQIAHLNNKIISGDTFYALPIINQLVPIFYINSDIVGFNSFYNVLTSSYIINKDFIYKQDLYEYIKKELASFFKNDDNDIICKDNIEELIYILKLVYSDVECVDIIKKYINRKTIKIIGPSYSVLNKVIELSYSESFPTTIIQLFDHTNFVDDFDLEIEYLLYDDICAYNITNIKINSVYVNKILPKNECNYFIHSLLLELNALDSDCKIYITQESYNSFIDFSKQDYDICVDVCDKLLNKLIITDTIPEKEFQFKQKETTNW